MQEQNKGQPPAHLLMRYADDFAGTSDTIGEHQKVARKHKSVWIGKLGTMTLAEHRMERLRRQVIANIPTYLYLAARREDSLVVHSGRLLDVQRDCPSSRLVPSYYPKDRTFSLWVRVSSLRRVSLTTFAGVLIESSRNPAFQTLALSQAALFTVIVDKARQEEARTGPPRDWMLARRRRAECGRGGGDLRQRDPEDGLNEDEADNYDVEDSAPPDEDWEDI